MNFVPFGVRNVKPAGNRKKQASLEISLNLNYGVHAVGISHGIFHRKRISLHVRLIARIFRKNDFESHTARLRQIPNITWLSF